MTSEDLKKRINAELRAGRLADLGAPMDLAANGVLAHHWLSRRLAPLQPWQQRVGVRPVNEADLKGEIRSEFKRLRDQLLEGKV